jgi:membrane protein implicated in regulation of membrane protease activity
MVWWLWLAVGVALLVLEAFIQTEFWVAVIGGGALIVGALAWLGLAESTAVQWLVFGGSSIALAVLVRRKLHESLVGKAPGLKPELVGERATAETAMAPEADGHVVLRGSRWRARNVGLDAIAVGEGVRVDEVDGVILNVRATTAT